MLLAAAYETCLLLDPGPAIAAQLLKVYCDDKYTQTFLTPQWAYRAALIVLENSNNEMGKESMDAYGLALVLLDRASARWKGVEAMSASLRSFMQNRADSKTVIS